MSKLDTDVVAITPFTVEVIIPAFAMSVLELMIEVEEATPFTTDVSVFTALERSFELTKLAVVVVITPFVSEVRMKLLVEVETERVWEVMMEDVAMLPATLVVSTLPVAD